MINKEEILNHIERQGRHSSITEIEALVDKQNRDEIKKEQSKRFRYEIWDKKSNINGVSAKEIIKSRKYEIGSVYLIYVDGGLVYFQDHNPNEGGYVKMTKSNVEQIAQDFMDKKIEEYVDNIIVSNVINIILSR